MISVFYQKEIIGDTLLVSISTKQNSTNIENFKTHTLIKNQEEIISINIFNVSKSLKIKNGFIYPSKKILDFVFKITNIDLSKYVEKKYIVVSVIDVKKIDNTHLTKCIINDGTQNFELICGAENVEKNIMAIWVKDESFLPNGSLIREAKIQNITSKGMLCGYKDLNMLNQDNKKGIIILDKTNLIGTEFTKHYIKD